MIFSVRIAEVQKVEQPEDLDRTLHFMFLQAMPGV
jgi:hypothetical protein